MGRVGQDCRALQGPACQECCARDQLSPLLGVQTSQRRGTEHGADDVLRHSARSGRSDPELCHQLGDLDWLQELLEESQVQLQEISRLLEEESSQPAHTQGQRERGQKRQVSALHTARDTQRQQQQQQH